MWRFVLALMFTSILPTSAFAWGDHGHRIVCELAFRLALPETRAEIRRLIQQDSQFDFFRDACIWPDHPRQRASEHFINLARTSTGLTANVCPLAGNCALSAIQSDLAVLSSTASDEKKLAALKFLGHWVGDIHQPLHVSFEDDRGGNQVLTQGQCRPNLHSTWDTCLVVQAVGADVPAAVKDLLSDITPVLREQWTQASDPMDWANESFAITRAASTRYCVQQGSSCDLPSGATNIDADYVQSSRSIVRGQLAKAGVRLAHLLNAALGK